MTDHRRATRADAPRSFCAAVDVRMIPVFVPRWPHARRRTTCPKQLGSGAPLPDAIAGATRPQIPGHTESLLPEPAGGEFGDRRHGPLQLPDYRSRGAGSTLDGPAVCRLFNQTIAETDTLPRCPSSDHDPQFGFHRWKANRRVVEASEVKTMPYLPLSYPFVERFTGAIQWEHLDSVTGAF